jgi:hypothetical protein
VLSIGSFRGSIPSISRMITSFIIQYLAGKPRQLISGSLVRDRSLFARVPQQNREIRLMTFLDPGAFIGIYLGRGRPSRSQVFTLELFPDGRPSTRELQRPGRVGAGNAHCPVSAIWRWMDASGVSHADRLLLSAVLARVTFSRMSLAFAVQMKGLGSSLWPSMYSPIAMINCSRS